VLKPTLTAENMFTRLMFAADEVVKVPGSFCYKFKEMYDRIHVDVSQDGAKFYLAADEGAGLGLNIRPYYQPANSPDTNIQDLACFVSLQADIKKVPKKNMGDLIVAVQQAYDAYPNVRSMYPSFLDST
jgi:hypothetical protein